MGGEGINDRQSIRVLAVKALSKTRNRPGLTVKNPLTIGRRSLLKERALLER